MCSTLRIDCTSTLQGRASLCIFEPMSDHARNGTPEAGEGPIPGAGSDEIASNPQDEAPEASADGGAAAEAQGQAAPPDGAEGQGEAAADGEAAGDELAERVAQLEAEKAALEREKQEYWERVLRATADLDNFRKRSRRELEDARYDARTKVLKEMLPVIDNLERAVDHAVQSGAASADSGIVEGVQLVLRQFAQALERCDVTPVDAKGKPFDPNVHEAISQAETDEHPPGMVVQVLQKGYKIGDRLLRPSLVVVAKAPPQPAAEEPSSSSSESAEGEAAGSGDEGQEA